jgi:hypothetical protein
LIMVMIFGVSCMPMTHIFGLEGTTWSVVIAAMISHVIIFLMCIQQFNKSEIRNFTSCVYLGRR